VPCAFDNIHGLVRTLTRPFDRHVHLAEQDQTARQGTRGKHLVLLIPRSLYGKGRLHLHYHTQNVDIIPVLVHHHGLVFYHE
jgi:hypothetical protein